MMNINIAVLLTAIGIIAIWDTYAMWKHGLEKTLTALLIKGSKKNPIIPFLFGLFCGHLFWSSTVVCS